MFLVAFLGIFAVSGSALGYFLSFRPLSRVWQARSWTAADCEVISSRVVHNDDTSRPDIRYRYYVADRPYISDRYNFVTVSTSGSGAADTVARYAPGTRFPCYVNPSDPTQAVINRDVTFVYFIGLIGFAVFAGVPVLVGTFVVRGLSKARSAQQIAETSVRARALDAGSIGVVTDLGPAVLQPTVSPMGKLITATIVCLFWNGIVGVFTYFEIREFMGGGGGGGWFMAIFLLLFQIIGVGLLLSVPYQMLALANPRPMLTLSRSTLPIGGAVPFEWQLIGAASRVSRLTMTLQGREEARYRRGTDTHTDKHVFHSVVVAEATDPMNIERGNGTIRIPAGTMHSFTANNNKIIWTLSVKGEINRWPDVDESFDITVSPA